MVQGVMEPAVTSAMFSSFFFSPKCERCPRSASLFMAPLGQFGDTLLFPTCVSPVRCLLHAVKVCTTRVEPLFFTLLEVSLYICLVSFFSETRPLSSHVVAHQIS